MLFNHDQTRLTRVKWIEPAQTANFLLIPGGPGVDSASLAGLVEAMDLPGQYWLVDFPQNGTNEQPDLPAGQCRHWPQYLQNLVAEIDNPVVVGHSFGGYLPFFCPELENCLCGLIVIGSTPTLNSPIFTSVAQKHGLPSLDPARKKFVEHPSLASLQGLYMAEADYFFVPQYKQIGIDTIIKPLQYCVETEYWWYSGGIDAYAEITWVPQAVPTLILTGEQDCICPIDLFSADSRFNRDNIQTVSLANTGHFPWLENTRDLQRAIRNFSELLKGN